MNDTAIYLACKDHAQFYREKSGDIIPNMLRTPIKEALQIAQRDLRTCYVSEGIIAGPHHFTDVWGRDGYFAALGAMTLGGQEDFAVINRMIDQFFSFQLPSGMLPYRLMRSKMTLGKYRGKPTYLETPQPTYRLRGIGQNILDGTTLTVLFSALMNRKEHLQKIISALEFLKTKEKNGLLWDGPMAEWNDCVWKFGNLLYSNVIYWYMYDRLEHFSLGFDKKLSLEFSQKKQHIAEALRKRLWNGKYFADWNDIKRHDYLYPYGNCLAVAWGLTNEEESHSILDSVGGATAQFGIQTNTPKYPWWRVDFLHRAIGMGDYQNQSVIWWQPVISFLSALQKMGRKKEAEKLAQKISAKIVVDQQIHECYEPNGKNEPVKRLAYQSESPFAWASGMIVHVLSQL